MDSELEELESLFSEHFGRTPANTPAASQDIGACSSTSDDDDEETDGIVDIDERARQYVQSVVGGDSDSSGDSDLDEDHTRIEANLLQSDDPDIAKIRNYHANGCGCKSNCVSQFSEQVMFSHILDMREMTKNEKELYVMGSLTENDREVTKRGKKMKRSRHSLTFSGRPVCKKTYLLLYDIGKHTLQKIKSHMQSQGVTPRQHGNVGKKPAHALNFEDPKRVVQFISNYGDEYGLPQPAAPRGRDDVPPVYLSSEMTKKDCTNYMSIAATQKGMHHVLSNIDSVTEEEKLESTMQMQTHILRAREERDFYNTCIKSSRETIDLGHQNRFVHYTFDYSQNVTIPHHANQMEPLYFLSLRKVQLFGFRIDGEPKQLNFMIDENETIGQDGASTHGPDAVISMIDCAFQNHGIDELECTIHADNCGAQNKNQYVLGYMMWRVLTGQHDKITYSMQTPGQARCLIDGGFGMIKKLYRRSDCDNFDQLKSVVNNSSTTNMAVVYPEWQWRAWKTFLTQFFLPVKGIRKYQHFIFQRAEPGVVTVKESASSEELKINILKELNLQLNATDKPNIIQPRGFSEARATYLYRAVRPYVRPAHQDETCPQPQ